MDSPSSELSNKKKKINKSEAPLFNNLSYKTFFFCPDTSFSEGVGGLIGGNNG